MHYLDQASILYINISVLPALEKELVNKKDTIARLQEQISNFDEETKRAHKQFTINRENVEK